MKYFGLQSQIWRNNTNSIMIMVMFPFIFVGLTWLYFFITAMTSNEPASLSQINNISFRTIPLILAGVAVWFSIAWFTHSAMISKATSSHPLQRSENKRVYNLVENLCISRGMKTPLINVIEDESLNAFASGINEKTFSVSLSRGIIDKLNDDELEAVIAHELTHIRNRDVRLLIISVIFVGIFAFLSEMLLRSMRFGSLGKGKKGGSVIIILILAAIGWLIASLFRFSLSRNREFLADAGAVELTHKPFALASALRKVSADPTIEAVKRKDVAQMFIENPQVKNKNDSFSLSGLFATHPPIAKRIQILEQY